MIFRIGLAGCCRSILGLSLGLWETSFLKSWTSGSNRWHILRVLLWGPQGMRSDREKEFRPVKISTFMEEKEAYRK